MYQDTKPKPLIEPTPTEQIQEKRLEMQISNLLQSGVVLASAIVLIGGILYLMRHGSEPVDYRVFRGEPAIYCSLPGVLTAMIEGHRRGIIQFGLMILIATPILRVILCLFTFLRWRDLAYSFITILVLSGLIYSFVGAYF
jgi:uncharacterized membrane protein